MTRVGRWIQRLLPTLVIMGALAWFILPSDPTYAWRMAEQDWGAHRWYNALQRYRGLYDVGNRHPALLQRLADLAMLRGEWAEAEAYLRELLVGPLTPVERDQAWLAYGWTRLRRDDPDEALEVWASIEPRYPAVVPLLRVEAALHRGDVQSATALFNLVPPVPPEFRTLFILRAAELALFQSPDTAAAVLQQTTPDAAWQFLARSPQELQSDAVTLAGATTLGSDGRALVLARLWSNEGLQEAALVMYFQVPSTSDHAVTAQTEAIRLLWTNGQLVEAQARLQQALALHPNNLQLIRLQALILASTGDLAAASEVLNTAHDPRSITADDYVASAAVALAAQDFDGAAKAYDLAIQTAPVSGTYALQAASFYATTSLRTCTSGREYARLAVGTDVDAEARLMVADLALRCDDPNEALSATMPLESTHQHDPRWLYLYGAARWGLGERDAAREFLIRAADLAPRSSWRRQAERFLSAP